MSKLGDAIRRSQRIESAPMGFGAARPAAKASMLVGFRGASGAIDSAKAADFLLVEADKIDTAAVTALRAGAGESPLGVTAKPGGASKDLREAGLDFLVVDPESTPAAALLDEDMGYVLVLPSKPEELFLRSLDALSLEAVILADLPSPLTVAKQIVLTQVGGLSRKPVICEVPTDISSEDLQCLRAAGVVAIVTSSAAAIAGLKETVLALPPRRVRRDDRPVVSLPRGQAAPTEEDDDDDDDGD